DTSGSQLSGYVLRGLRWILDQAAALADSEDTPRPIIVNVSIGVLAGAKDGTDLLSRQVAAEVLRHEAATGAPCRVVFAFGNDALTRQVAHMTATHAAQTLTLRVQSEDYTPSFVEIRPNRPADLRLGLRGLSSAPLPLGPLAAGQAVTLLDGKGRAAARVYAVGARPLDGGGETAAWYLVALAPTATFAWDKPLAPSGVWEIDLASDGGDQDVRLEVQRDDRPMGFQPLARQSYFDDPALWDWRERPKSPYLPLATGPVTQAGTHSAYVDAQMPEQIYAVGAALSDTGFAAPYSAVGAPWVAPEPGTSAIGDSSWTLRGVLASGTLSGTAAVISGTSVAAPQIARELALMFLSGADIGPWHDASQNRTDEVAHLSALPWSFAPTYDLDRLGPVTVSRESGLRPRLDTGWG
ncbi:MAG: hypothetical protein AAF631_04925, partial [Pseudomonadota bacterium]